MRKRAYLALIMRTGTLEVKHEEKAAIVMQGEEGVEGRPAEA
jgi:hypothetical protein